MLCGMSTVAICWGELTLTVRDKISVITLLGPPVPDYPLSYYFSYVSGFLQDSSIATCLNYPPNVLTMMKQLICWRSYNTRLTQPMTHLLRRNGLMRTSDKEWASFRGGRGLHHGGMSLQSCTRNLSDMLHQGLWAHCRSSWLPCRQRSLLALKSTLSLLVVCSDLAFTTMNQWASCLLSHRPVVSYVLRTLSFKLPSRKLPLVRSCYHYPCVSFLMLISCVSVAMTTTMGVLSCLSVGWWSAVSTCLLPLRSHICDNLKHSFPIDMAEIVC